MGNYRDGKTIWSEIESKRKRLEDLVQKNLCNLQSDLILKNSRSLDQVIVSFYSLDHSEEPDIKECLT